MPGREDYEAFFQEADTDNSGTLTLDELIAALRNKGYRGSDEKLKVSTFITLLRGYNLKVVLYRYSIILCLVSTFTPFL